MKIIDILKHTIFHRKYELPILTIIDKKQNSIIELTKQFFIERDVLSLNELEKASFNSYNSIILDDISQIPNNLTKLIKNEGVIYYFSTNPIFISKKLSTMFKYVKTDKINIDLKLIKDKLLSKSIKFEFKEEYVYVVRASFSEIKEIEANIEISFSIVDKIIEQIIKNNIENNDEKLIYKQEFLKKTISELFYQNKKLNQKIKNDKNLINWELNKLEIEYIKRMINLNIDSVKNELRFLKELPFEKKAISRPFIVSDNEKAVKDKNIEISKISKELKHLEEKHTALIENNNSNISRISHLEFDLEESFKEKETLEKAIEELELIIEDSDTIYEEMVNNIKNENEKRIEKLTKEFNKKLEKHLEKNLEEKEKIKLLEEKIANCKKEETERKKERKKLQEMEKSNIKNKQNIKLLINEVKRLRELQK